MIAEPGGDEEAVANYGPKAERLSNGQLWARRREMTPKASRVAGVRRSVGDRRCGSEGRDEFSITEYQRFWNEGERQAYRLQVEFRELWPEFETPNELATQIVKHLDPKVAAKEARSLATKLQVTV